MNHDVPGSVAQIRIATCVIVITYSPKLTEPPRHGVDVSAIGMTGLPMLLLVGSAVCFSLWLIPAHI
jgi:hypothetical protein